TRSGNPGGPEWTHIRGFHKHSTHQLIDRREVTENLEPRVGVEPTTCRLRIDCSTTELPRPCLMTIAPAENHCQFAGNGKCGKVFNGKTGTWPSRHRCPPAEREKATRGCTSRGPWGGGVPEIRRPRK